MNKKLVNIEAGRGVAAILVVLYHVDRYYFDTTKYWSDDGLYGLFKFGHSGVQFFFVLSGYIMMSVHRDDIGRRSKVFQFLEKRFCRIYPFFWIILAITISLYFIFPNSGRDIYRDPENILQSFFLVGQDPMHSEVFVSWTLWHEIIFYAIFALIIAFPRIGIVTLILWVSLSAVTPLFNIMALFPTYFPSYITAFINILFAVGIAASAMLQRFTIPYPRILFALGAAVFFCTGLISDMTNWISSDLSSILYGLGSAMIILGSVEAERSGNLRAPRWLVILGGASYSIYLTHMLILPLAAKASARVGLTHVLPAWLAFVGLTTTALVAGVLINRMVETRVVAISRKFIEILDTSIRGRHVARSHGRQNDN